jgi:hypothetical protein
MKISDLRNFIMEPCKDELAKRERSFQLSRVASVAFEKFTLGRIPENMRDTFRPEMLHRLALEESKRTELKITQAFGLGILSPSIDTLGSDEERSTMYQEIIEYLQLVQAGIDSFVATHPIKAIEEGGAGDE